MATAMAGPVAAEQNSEAWARKAQPVWSAMASKMVPMSRDANKPKAMAPMASTKYRFKLISICFRARNDRKRLD